MSVLVTSLALLASQPVAATKPIAPHQLVVVDASGDTLIRLTGYDLDGDSLVATVITLPGSSGSVYQLSKVFSDYGYEPKQGKSLSGGEIVTGSGNRVYYKRPAADVATVGSWGIMKYTVADAGETSYEGMVTLVPPSGILVGSHFARGAEGWTIVGNKASSTAVSYEASSRGLMNHYVYGSDDTINTMGPGQDADRSLWYFVAPQKFLGHHGISYGGSLDFVLSSFHGDFSAGKLNTGLDSSGLHLVELYCATCNVNRGVTLAFPAKATAAFTGAATSYSITLTESAGWLQDPKNTLVSWFKPSKCQFIEVLSGLSSVKILGDFTTWYESVALDTVQFRNLKAKVPICAQLTPDASGCTCSA